MKQALQGVLPGNAYAVLRNLYRFFAGPKEAPGLDAKSLELNEDLFDVLDFRRDVVAEILREHGYQYEDANLSWHYHLFAGWSDFCQRNGFEVKNILEIGTHNGEFAYFLSNLFSEATVYTIDLPLDDEYFLNSNGRETAEKLERFVTVRGENLNYKNIRFIEMNSINILNHFQGRRFDAIWIDGDHHNPQVTIDLINSISLLSPNGIMCSDDVIQDPGHKKDAYVSNESFQTLRHLEKNEVLNNLFLVKRTRSLKGETRKFISVSKIN